MKNISIIGSTGSIGTQTLNIVRLNPDKLKVLAISGNSNIALLEKQILEFNPKICAVMDAENAARLKARISTKTKIVSGMQGLLESVCLQDIEIVVTAISGMIGLQPTLEAIKHKKNIALANKETLVAGGSLVMNMAKEYGVCILPVDSEHSAIFQAMQGNQTTAVKKIILTASGGPFRGKKRIDLLQVSRQDVLKHPNWHMGEKITVDSATLMNKGLEAIEARWLFDVSMDQIEVVVHPQSIVHSAVEFIDRSVIAQMGYPDMTLPIQYALFYPERISNLTPSLDLTAIGNLTFEKPDLDTFPCLALAFEAMSIGKSMPIVLNKANEIAVELYLKNRIAFVEIPQLIGDVMSKHSPIDIGCLDDILNVSAWTEKNIRNN
ncbi:MAG: 1-deoxy-D-xylulose 5-phosphate reductoisomerase [Clostridiales bacterium 38_11]|nr:MAG: 1-deoxy-D-xylulose 5-phosphate reductoisomerase [Clostridiales bacterium 38_11]HBH12067.1 1-deoxy-D-xylulose-5-phosphate reductoisomerase [Clostridiales bacterium]